MIDERLVDVNESIQSNYNKAIKEIDDQLNNYKADVNQYMRYNENGLTLGALESEFSTVIDNQGMYFKQGDTTVSYINNKQLFIPNAVIEKTLMIGNFFFSPHTKDGDSGFSITWHED